MNHLPECLPVLRYLTGEWVDENSGESECCICAVIRDTEHRIIRERGTVAAECIAEGFKHGVWASRQAIADLPYMHMLKRDDGMGSTAGKSVPNTIEPLIKKSDAISTIDSLLEK